MQYFDIFISLALIVVTYILYTSWQPSNTQTTINPETTIKIKSLYVYPVKSTKGFEVTKWKLSKYGMKHDREYLVYSPKSKSVITQRQVNCMALIQARLMFTNDDESSEITGLQFSAPKMDDIFIPIADENDEKNQVSDIKWFMDKLTGSDQGNTISEWLTKYLNGDCDQNKKEKEYRLMRVSSKYYRGLNNSETSDEIVILNQNVPKLLMNSALAPYSDAYPLLIVSESSFNEVNKRLKENTGDSIEINRFRPNIVIQSDLKQAFIEDRITKLIHNDNTTFYLRAPCPRCIMPTINQQTAEMNKSKEPRITLKQFRTGKHLGYDKVHHEQLFFGMYGVHNKYDVEIAQGDEIKAVFKK